MQERKTEREEGRKKESLERGQVGKSKSGRRRRERKEGIYLRKDKKKKVRKKKRKKE